MLSLVKTNRMGVDKVVVIEMATTTEKVYAWQVLKSYKSLR